MIVERTVCAVCKGTKFTPDVNIDSRNIVACLNCGFQFARRFDTDAIDKYYREDYYPSPDASRMNTWISQNILVWRSLCDDIVSAKPSVDKLLDIGAGTGGFIMEFHAQSQETRLSAIESSRNAREFVSNKIPSVEFLDGLPESETFDAITCLQTLEHVQEPDVLCRKIFNALNPGGLFLITVPNTACLSHLWKKKEQTLCYGNPTHLQFFNTVSVESMLRNAGFKKINRVVKMDKGNRRLFFSVVQYFARLAGLSSELRYIAVKG